VIVRSVATGGRPTHKTAHPMPPAALDAGVPD
jgi:hypothetical protein